MLRPQWYLRRLVTRTGLLPVNVIVAPQRYESIQTLTESLNGAQRATIEFSSAELDSRKIVTAESWLRLNAAEIVWLKDWMRDKRCHAFNLSQR
jgi:hypothetical protein